MESISQAETLVSQDRLPAATAEATLRGVEHAPLCVPEGEGKERKRHLQAREGCQDARPQRRACSPLLIGGGGKNASYEFCGRLTVKGTWQLSRITSRRRCGNSAPLDHWGTGTKVHWLLRERRDSQTPEFSILGRVTRLVQWRHLSRIGQDHRSRPGSIPCLNQIPFFFNRLYTPAMTLSPRAWENPSPGPVICALWWSLPACAGEPVCTAAEASSYICSCSSAEHQPVSLFGTLQGTARTAPIMSVASAPGAGRMMTGASSRSGERLRTLTRLQSKESGR